MRIVWAKGKYTQGKLVPSEKNNKIQNTLPHISSVISLEAAPGDSQIVQVAMAV